jgi:carbon monoxide dehydrogenase subunit G
MLEAKVVDTIHADIESVWAELGNFSGIKAGPGIDSVDYEGEGEGMTRSINMSNGSVVERLEVHDATEKVFTYSIINEDSPLPFSGYSATVCLADKGDGITTVDWTGSFDARGVEDEKAVKLAKGIYSNAINNAKKLLEAQ